MPNEYFDDVEAVLGVFVDWLLIAVPSLAW